MTNDTIEGISSNYTPFWSKLKGKPYISVSAKGISNGLSSVWNDGADFGPDTTLGVTSPSQVGTPYTQTSGIQEAVNYVKNNPKKIFLSAGIYYIETTIVLPSSDTSQEFYLEGEVVSFTTAQQSIGNTLGTIIYARGSTGTNGYTILTVAAPSSGEVGPRVHLENITLRQPDVNVDNANGLDLSYAQEHIINNMLIDVDQDHYTMPLNTANQNGMLLEIDGLGGSIRSITNTRIIGYAIAVYQIGDLCTFYNLIIEFCLYGLDIGSNSNNIYHMVDLSFIYMNQVIYGIVLNSFCENGLQVVGHIDFQGSTTSSNLQNPNFVWGTLNGLPTMGSINKVGLNVTGIIEYEIVGINGQGCIAGYFWNTTTPGTRLVTKNNSIFDAELISTPSVPASGTAQQNTNPYDVKVYVNGGAMTEIQITIGSTAYTVYSNSTASAVYEGFTLPAGASITLTYTTAPTWTWLPA